MQDLIGRTFGHYRIVEQIGEGDMGFVYRAHDERLNKNARSSAFQNSDPLCHRGEEIHRPNLDRGSIGEEAFNL